MADLLLLNGLSQCPCHHLLADPGPRYQLQYFRYKLDTLVLNSKHLKVQCTDQDGDKLSHTPDQLIMVRHSEDQRSKLRS